MDEERTRVCPVELAKSLDNKIRRWIQNPKKILSPYVREGMTALDVGCGPGFFSLELAKLVGEKGRVIAADLQQGMLQIIENKIKGSPLERRFKLVQCDKDNINVADQVDFILTFYMVHEVPDKKNLFKQLSQVLKNQGQYLLVEPKLFHVSRKEFETTLEIARINGFEVYPGPQLLLSWSAILKKKNG